MENQTNIQASKGAKNKALIAVLVIVALIVIIIEYNKPASSGQAQSISLQALTTNENSSKNGNDNSNGNVATSSTKPVQITQSRADIIKHKASKYDSAIELADIQGYVNTGPFKLADYIGKKVILVDFWTYSCINCQRTLPYVNAWYDKYKDKGLVIVGVHTPEFDFEKDLKNVSNATVRLGVKYPVVLDSNHGTWNAYQNRYWPHEYLIDIDGFISHDHIGEGDYDVTERAIQAALKERNTELGIDPASNPIPTDIASPLTVVSMDVSKVGSRETYFGSARNEFLGNGMQGKAGQQQLTLPASVLPNTLYLDGNWNFNDQFAEATMPASGQAKSTHTIIYNFTAKNVYFVAAANQALAPKGVTVHVYEDGKLVNTLTVSDNRLYTLINDADYGTHTLRLEVEGQGLQAFTFTFG